MNQQEKLIELLETIVLPRKELYSACEIADFMLDYGVVVLPCKIGDTVYVPYPALNSVEQFPIESIEIYKSSTVFCTDTCNVEFNASDFGKTVFLTREEAEKALAK